MAGLVKEARVDPNKNNYFGLKIILAASSRMLARTNIFKIAVSPTPYLHLERRSLYNRRSVII